MGATSLSVITVRSDADTIIDVSRWRMTVQNQGLFELRARELRGAADVALGTEGGTVGYVIPACAAGTKSSPPLISEQSPWTWALRVIDPLGVATCQVLVDRETT